MRLGETMTIATFPAVNTCVLIAALFDQMAFKACPCEDEQSGFVPACQIIPCPSLLEFWHQVKPARSPANMLSHAC